MGPEQISTMPNDDARPRLGASNGPGRVATRCYARPLAAQTGFEADARCASAAISLVLFAGGHLPVCSLHEATYRRWARDAEANAAAYWLWRRT